MDAQLDQSEKEIGTMIEEKDPLVWTALYNRYALSMYGMICSLTDDVVVAEKILIDVFVTLKQGKLLESVKGGLCPNLLRFTYAHTLKRLKQYGIQPKAINTMEEIKLIRLLCTQCTSIADVALILNQSEEEVRKRLRTEFLNIRMELPKIKNANNQSAQIDFYKEIN